METGRASPTTGAAQTIRGRTTMRWLTLRPACASWRLAAITFGTLALIVAVCGPRPLMAAPATASTEPLFVEIGVSAVDVPSDPTIARARVVAVNFDAFNGQASTTAGSMGVADEISLNLFRDALLIATLDVADGDMNVPGQRLTWIGHLAGAPDDRVVLVAGDGTLAGSILTRQGIYEIRYLAPGYHAVMQVNQGAQGTD